MDARLTEPGAPLVSVMEFDDFVTVVARIQNVL
jgi:hypothetical protein